MKISELECQSINDEIFGKKQLKVFMLRLDQSDAIISGNKWFKLKYNLIEAKKTHCQTVLSFGGAYSNHLHALATAAKSFGFSSIGIIRGEPVESLNNTLQDVVNMGMHLHYIDRKTYRNKTNPKFLNQLINSFVAEYGKIYLVPEGGTNNFALQGAAEIPQIIKINYDYLCLGCGTGGTLAGIATAAEVQNNVQIVGFPALKGAGFLTNDIHQLHQDYQHKQYQNWSLNLDYHFGGFGKKNKQLLSFLDYFYKRHQIELDFVYTGKMMYGIYDLAEKNYFEPDSTIVCIHTGGVQGNRSLIN